MNDRSGRANGRGCTYGRVFFNNARSAIQGERTRRSYSVLRRTESKLVLLVGRYGIPVNRAARHLRGTRKIDWTEVVHATSSSILINRGQ